MPDTIWVVSETSFVAGVKSFVAILCLICLTGACFRYDLGVLRETAVAQIQAWRARVSGGRFPDGGAALVGCEELAFAIYSTLAVAGKCFFVSAVCRVCRVGVLVHLGVCS